MSNTPDPNLLRDLIRFLKMAIESKLATELVRDNIQGCLKHLDGGGRGEELEIRVIPVERSETEGGEDHVDGSH